MIKPQVSKSLMLDYGEYVNADMCGLVFEAKHITKTYPDVYIKAARLGEYVEFIVLGNVPERLKNQGITVVEPEKTAKGTMTADYQRAHDRALKLKNLLFDVMKLKKKSSGLRVTNEWGSGILDCELEGDYFGYKPNGEPLTVTFDLKYSGLIDDPWTEYGFAFEGRSADLQKRRHGMQAKQYENITGNPFVLGVLSSKYSSDKEEDDQFHFEFIKLVSDPEELLAHRESALYIREKVNLEAAIGFKPYPELARCEACAIKQGCKSRAVVPPIRIVNLARNE